MLSAGSLQRRITIQAQTTTQDSYGAEQQTWNDVLSCWASIKAASSREVYAAAGFVSQLSHIVTIRYTTTAITSAMRVLYGTRTFLVQAVVDPDESRVMLNLYCLERDA